MHQTPSDDELMTATQVGALANRSGRTILRAAEAGEIPVAAKVPGPNGAYLFRRGDAVEFAAKITEQASA